MPSNFSFIFGGAASGKSAFAEAQADKSGKEKIYLATARIQDDEMRARVDRHIAARSDGWTTIQTPLHLEPVLSPLRGQQICLIDCATLWLSNHLLAGSNLATMQSELLAALKACEADLIIVSNEVGHGIVPDNALARRFREAQGRLNIALAAHADLVVQVTAGLPRVLKGHLP
jgi:adenosylcobinamide kinase / adenosylcobinamide-phosphate guanylyltransferase